MFSIIHGFRHPLGSWNVFPEDKGGVLYPAPNANTTEISQGDKETSMTNKLFCIRSKQELVKREEKTKVGKQDRREVWLNNMPKMLED